MWIDAEFANVGDVGFLIKTVDTSTGKTTWSIRDTPLRTNQSNVARLSGWCGETDNKSRYARGVIQITRVSTDGMRAEVKKLHGVAHENALAKVGYTDIDFEET